MAEPMIELQWRAERLARHTEEAGLYKCFETEYGAHWLADGAMA